MPITTNHNKEISESEIISFDKGTEVVIKNEQIGIVISDGLIVFNEHKYYLVETGNKVVKVSHENVVSSKKWATRKILNSFDESLFWRKMVHKKTSTVCFIL
jgi:hypothetical protein